MNKTDVLLTVPLQMLCYFGPSRETTLIVICYLNKLSQLEMFKLLNSDLLLWCVFFFCLSGCVRSSTDQLLQKNNGASRNITCKQGVVMGDKKEKTERKSFNNGFLQSHVRTRGVFDASEQ